VASAETVEEADGEGLGEPVVAPLDAAGPADVEGLSRACGVPLEADVDGDETAEPCAAPLGCPAVPALADGLAVAVLEAPEAAPAGTVAESFGWKLRGR
jgi:hypothetical protein